MAQGRVAGLRLATAERTQQAFELMVLDDLVPQEHRVRQVLAYVEGLDLSELYQRIRSYEGSAGRPGIDPAILMTLWLYATLEDVGSARQLERLCEKDVSYRWVLGGIKVSHKTLSDFRVEAGGFLDGLLSSSIAALVTAKIVSLDSVAVDGMRVRASAGLNSFRRKKRLTELEELARKKVETLRAELESDPAASDRRRQARQRRAAEDRLRRLERAQQALSEIEAQRAKEAQEQRRKKPKKGKREPRTSPTDAQARLMKMADGGYRPGFNARFVTEVGSQLVVGVNVGNNASDRGQLEPAVEELDERYEQRPKEVLADSGFDAQSDIEALHRAENGAIDVYCPWPSNKKGEPRLLRKQHGPGVRAWHERMVHGDGAEVYKRRFACERPHADMRNRGLTQVLVRGMEKVKAVVLWHVHAYNFLTISRLKAAT